MELLNSVGLIFIFAMAPIGAATSIYVFRLGWQVLTRRLRLGELCQQQADEVVNDIQVPMLKPRVIK